MATAIVAKAPRRSFWKRIPSPLPFIKNIANDYAIVFRDLATESRSRPLKTLLLSGVLAGGFYAYKTNPTSHDLLARLAELRQEMVLLPQSSHNPKAVKELERYTGMLNTNRIRFCDCLLFTLVIGRPNDKLCNLYSTQDANLRKWPWYELWDNLVDVGALNKFWNLERSFVDYDICEEELRQNTVADPVPTGLRNVFAFKFLKSINF